MIQKMKNKILSIILTGILLLPIQVVAEETPSVLQNELSTIEEPSSIDTRAYSSQTIDEDNDYTENISQVNSSIPHKQPISKRKLVKKFLVAMILVGISFFVIYFILTAYQKVGKSVPPQIKISDGENPLTTPKDFESAVKTFLEKTKWQS